MLAAIVGLGLILRFWGISYGLPYTYAPDEPTYLEITLRMIRSGDLNPHWWYYPSFMFYLNAAAFVPYFLFGRALGLFSTPADIPLPQIITMGVGRLEMPSEFLLTRGLVAALSTLGILLVYLIGRRLHSGSWVGLGAALFYAVSPTIVSSGQRMGPDTIALFFALVSFYFTIRSVDEPTTRNYVLAGIGAGLAIASKYNVGLILIPLLLSISFSPRAKTIDKRQLLFALGSVAVTFIVATPFALLDWGGFSEGVRFQAFSYTAEGHPGEEGNALAWYMGYLFETEGWIVAAALAGALYSAASRVRKSIMLISFPLVYGFVVSMMLVRNSRTILQLVPFLDLLAALAIVVTIEWILRTLKGNKRLVGAAVVLPLVALVALPFQHVLATNLAMGDLGERENARVWIEQNLPVGSRIAQEAYTSFIDPDKYAIEANVGLIDRSPEWYRENGFEFLVASSAIYGRYFQEPERYPEYLAKYNQLFTRFPTIANFEGAFTTRILRVDSVPLPEHRVNAEWGYNGAWVELIGYDWQDPEMELYWRILKDRHPPLELTARLLSNDALQSSSTNVLLPLPLEGKMATGILRVPLNVVTPSDARPGLYSLEMTLQAHGEGSVPLLNGAGTPVSDKLLVGPLKFPTGDIQGAEWSNAREIGSRFGDKIILDRYYLPRVLVAPGTLLALTLYWQAQEVLSKDYTVFIHLLDGRGRVVAQIDSIPAQGRYPTIAWSPGERVRDTFMLPIPPDIEKGEYSIEAGMYEYPAMTRLPVISADGQIIDDRIILGHVTVGP